MLLTKVPSTIKNTMEHRKMGVHSTPPQGMCHNWRDDRNTSKGNQHNLFVRMSLNKSLAPCPSPTVCEPSLPGLLCEDGNRHSKSLCGWRAGLSDSTGDPGCWWHTLAALFPGRGSSVSCFPPSEANDAPQMVLPQWEHEISSRWLLCPTFKSQSSNSEEGILYHFSASWYL